MEALIKNLRPLKTIEAAAVEIDLLSSPQINWYLPNMLAKYSLNGLSNVVKPGKISVPGDMVRVFKIIPDDADVKIRSTTRRLIIDYESTIYKIKYHASEIDIPECREEDGRVAIMSAESLLKSFRSLPDSGDKVIFNFKESLVEVLLFDPKIHAKIAADCQSTKIFSYCIDKKAIQTLKILLRDAKGDIWISGNDNIIRVTSGCWVSEIVAKEYTAITWEESGYFGLRVEAVINKMLRFFRVLSICKSPCRIWFSDNRIVGEATSDILSERIEVPVNIYGASLRNAITVNPETFICALEGCKVFGSTVAIQIGENCPVKVSCPYYDCDFLIFPISENYCQPDFYGEREMATACT
ncbi:MAG: hypothetical protein IBX72_13720 [Nitrospirae bacterium]|nr:hypothetical protein [Nitrospirota bacterium]